MIEQVDWWGRRQFLAPEKLQALGYMNLVWTNCEAWLWEIFREVLGRGTKVARIVAHDIGDVALWEKIKLLAKESEFEEDIIDALAHAEKFYNVCRVNRNQFTHVSLVAAGRSDDPADGSALRLARNKGPSLEKPLLADSIENVKRVCEEIEQCKGYLASVCMIMGFRRMPRPASGEKPPALPEKPTLPALIYSPPPQRIARSARRQPPSPA